MVWVNQEDLITLTKPQSLNMKGKACIYATIGVAALAMWYGMAVMFG